MLSAFVGVLREVSELFRTYRCISSSGNRVGLDETVLLRIVPGGCLTVEKSIILTESMRDELVKRRREGESWRKLASRFGVSPSTIGRWLVRDDVACFVEYYGCRITADPHCEFYRGFAVYDYAKLSRYVEIGVYRLKAREQVQIQDFNLDKSTVRSERLSSWTARSEAVHQHPLHNNVPVGAPSIDIPVDALTLDYEFTSGDCAFLKEHNGKINHISREQKTALVTMDDGNEIEVPIALLDKVYSPEQKEFTRGDQAYLRREEFQIEDINYKRQIARVGIRGYHGIEIPMALLAASRWDKEKTTARNFFVRGDEKAMLGDFEGASDDFAQATFLNPGFTEAYVGKGVTTAELRGDSDGMAIDDYCTAITIDPENALAYFKRCVSNYRLFHVREEDFEIAACHNQCLPYHMRFRPKDAKPNFEAALQRAKQEGNRRLEGYIERWLRQIY